MKLLKLLKFNKKEKNVLLKKSIEIDPYLYWKNILLIMLVLLIIVGIFSTLIVYIVDNQGFVDEASKSEVKELVIVEFKETDLTDLVTAFDERSKNRTDIINTKNQIKDPSKPSNVVNSQLPGSVVQNSAR